MSDLQELTQEVRGLRTLIDALRVALAPSEQARPLTAAEMMVRWQISGETEALRLGNLRRRCEAWGLRKMTGTAGMGQTFMLGDVIAAENFGNGTTTRRRSKRAA